MTPPSEIRPQFAFSWESVARLGRLVRKELLEILRDRRTILTLVLMPVLLYPLLTVAFQQFIAASRIDPSKGQVYHIGFANEAEAGAFLRLVEPDMQRSDRKAKKRKADDETKFKVEIGADVEQLVRANAVDVGIRLLPPARRKGDVDFTLDAEVLYLPSAPGAQGALTFLENLLARRNVRLLETRLNLPEVKRGLVVLKLQRAPLPETGSGSVVSLSALVPLILILMTITGAVYPAIDLTAGERERGTLEILVAAPVPRLGLLFAKYVSVLTVAVLTALVNLLTMTITLKLSGMGHLLFGTEGWPLLLVVEMFGLLLLFAAFFSAVLLSLTSFARSFKEAQAYLIPLMLASLGPGLIGMIPGLKLENLAFAPLINIVLLARDLFEGGVEPASAFLVVLSTLLYSLAALALAARIFGAEGVLYSEQSSWSDLWRRPREVHPAASVGAALACLGLIIPGNFLVQALVREADFLTLGMKIAAMSLGSAILFAGFPLVGAYLGRVDLRQGFALRWPSLPALAGGMFLGLALWPFVLQLLLYWHAGQENALTEQADAMLASWRQAGRTMRLGLALSLGSVALAEEFFFRGYLFAALERANKAALTIPVTAMLFGLMHCLVAGGLGFEQLLPATLLGLVLGTIRWRTGSVLPGMVLHVCHNVLLSLISIEAESWQDQVPTLYLGLGAVGTLVGVGLLWMGSTRR